jgi:hypothetical protein
VLICLKKAWKYSKVKHLSSQVNVDGTNIIKTIVNEEAAQKMAAAKEEQKVAVSLNMLNQGSQALGPPDAFVWLSKIDNIINIE